MDYKKYRAKYKALIIFLFILTLIISALCVYFLAFGSTRFRFKYICFTAPGVLLVSAYFAYKSLKDKYIELRKNSAYFHLFNIKYSKGKVPGSVGFDSVNYQNSSQSAYQSAFMPRIIEISYESITGIDINSIPVIGITSILISTKNLGGKILVTRSISSIYEMAYELCCNAKRANPKVYISPLLIAEIESKLNRELI